MHAKVVLQTLAVAHQIVSAPQLRGSIQAAVTLANTKSVQKALGWHQAAAEGFECHSPPSKFLDRYNPSR